MGRTYLIGGLNGVGKSTFVERVASTDSRFIPIKGSHSLMKWLGINPGDYRGLSLIADEVKDLEMAKMMRALLRKYRSTEKTILFDINYLIIERGGISQATGPWVQSVSAMVLLFAPSTHILGRIEADKDKRSRPIFPASIVTNDERKLAIQQYKSLTRKEAMRLSKEYLKPIETISNSNGRLAGAVEDFLCFHRSLISGSGAFV